MTRPISEYREALDGACGACVGPEEHATLSAALDELEQAREHVRVLREALETIISVAFQECQPDRGDLFSKLDDVARAALSSTGAGGGG